MIDPAELAALHQARFPELPLDCGDDAEPGVGVAEEWSDWSGFGTTAGQLRIEGYLDRLGMRGKSILHIGIGNSGLAARFARQASRVVGTTIEPREAEKAASLRLPHYQAVIHNKHSGPSDSVSGRFDVIVDNNPTCFACCIKHFGAMLDFYRATLADGGFVITDRSDLAWHNDAPGSHPRWSFDFDDLQAAASLIGLKAFRANEDIYLLARERPPAPTFASQARFHARRIARKLWRIVTLRGKLLGR